MIPNTDSYYHSVFAKYASDGRVKQGYTDAGRLAVPLSSGWAAYNRSIYPIIDGQGRERYVTLKQHKVYMYALGRIAMDDCDTTLRAIGTALSVCPQTVSNALRRFASWGILGYLSNKGKYGGLTLFGRSKGDGLEHYARAALAAIRAAWTRRMDRIRAQSNVQSGSDRVNQYAVTYPSSSSVDIRMRDDRIEAVLMGMQHGMMRRVPCPAHEGEGRNLSFWRRQNGSLGVKCWSHQCTSHEIKDAIEPFRA